jgi:hypothetical protein
VPAIQANDGATAADWRMPARARTLLCLLTVGLLPACGDGDVSSIPRVPIGSDGCPTVSYVKANGAACSPDGKSCVRGPDVLG